MHNGLKFLDTAGNTHAVSESHPLPVTGGSTAPLPTGASTAALQTTGNTALGPATARPAVVDPTAAADINQLLRGILTALNTIAVNTTPP